MDEQGVLNILSKFGAVITNSHFVYSSWKHGSDYINKDAIYPHTLATSRLCRAIAKRFADDNVEVVIAPAIGGVILSQWTAHHLSEITGREVLGIYAEKEGMELISSSYCPFPPKYEDKFVIKRGYAQLITGRRVLVVDDVLTTGGSVKKVIEAIYRLGCAIVGVGVICNRGGITAESVGVPKLEALVNAKMDEWMEADCPLCEQKVPINLDFGNGRKFAKKGM